MDFPTVISIIGLGVTILAVISGVLKYLLKQIHDGDKELKEETSKLHERINKSNECFNKSLNDIAENNRCHFVDKDNFESLKDIVKSMDKKLDILIAGNNTSK